jgi:hypothetical protein
MKRLFAAVLAVAVIGSTPGFAASRNGHGVRGSHPVIVHRGGGVRAPLAPPAAQNRIPAPLPPPPQAPAINGPLNPTGLPPMGGFRWP